MRADDFVKFLEAAIKLQKGNGYSSSSDLANGVYFHRWKNKVLVMAMNGYEMIWETFGELDEAGGLGFLPAGRLDAAQKDGLFPCKITSDDIMDTVLPLLKAIKSRSNTMFHWLAFDKGADDDRATLKAVIFGKDFEIPVRSVHDKDDEGFMLLYRQMIARDKDLAATEFLQPAKRSMGFLNVTTMSSICAWFMSHNYKPDGVVMQLWDSVDSDGKTRGVHHVLMWPDPGDIMPFADANYGAVLMERVTGNKDYAGGAYGD